MTLTVSGGVFDHAAIDKKIKDTEAMTAAPGFWNDTENAQRTMNELKYLKGRVEPWRELIAQAEELETLYDLGIEEKDQSVEEELKPLLEAAQKKFDELSILNLLSGEVDKNGCFLTIHSGAGGTEACDWAYMLSRMYIRWAERNGFKMETVDLQEDEGGIKSTTIQITGDYVYGKLKGEAGVHRLIRISPFDANARRHTSFSSVFIFPILDDTIKVDIRPEDLRVDTYRSGGKGGQHVNKTDSAVRFTHIPTGIVVTAYEPRNGNEHFEGKTLSILQRAERKRKCQIRRRKKRHFLGKSDPYLCFPAVHNGKRSPHKIRMWKYSVCNGR